MPVAALGTAEVGGQVGEGAVRLHDDRQRVHEVPALQLLEHLGQMPWKQEVVVTVIGDDPRAAFADHLMSHFFGMPDGLGPVPERHPRVSGARIGHHIAGVIADSVADHDQPKVSE